MSASDFFPVDPDYAVTRTLQPNLLRTRLESGREMFRQKGAPQRVFTLIFNRRAKAEWIAIEQFRLRMMTEYFTFQDKTANRNYSVHFDSEPIFEESGFEEHTIRLQLIEAVGAGVSGYPSFAAGDPYQTIPTAQATDLGPEGLQFTYSGYGYRVNGGFSQIFLDDLLTGGESPKTDVVLGLHRVRVVGGPPTSLDYLV
jgi:hypothetical protein